MRTSVFFVSKFVAVVHFCQIYLVCTIPEKQKKCFGKAFFVSKKGFLQLKMFAKKNIVWFNDTYI